MSFFIFLIPCETLPIGPGQREMVYLLWESVAFLPWAYVHSFDFGGLDPVGRPGYFSSEIAFPRLPWYGVTF